MKQTTRASEVVSTIPLRGASPAFGGSMTVASIGVAGITALAAFIASPAGAQSAPKTDAGAATATSSAKGDAGASAPLKGDAGAAPTAVTPAGTSDGGGALLDTRPPGTDGATYTVRLRDLESRVDELKDQIRRSHTKLSLLSDTILSGGVAGARANIVFQNKMSGAFRLTRALFVLDGAVQYNRQDESGGLANQKEIPIFSGNVPPGDHTISVVLNFQGSSLAVFQYLKGYKFEQKSSHAFTAGEGKALQITAVAYEKGNATTPYEDRPAVSWQEKIGAMASKAAAPPPPASNGAASGSVSVGGGK